MKLLRLILRTKGLDCRAGDTATLSGRIITGLNPFSIQGRCRRLVAQIFNLLYRRFSIGKAPTTLQALGLAEILQTARLRYGRLKICATGEMAGLVMILTSFPALAENTNNMVKPPIP